MEVFAVLASVQSMGLTGIQGYPVTVEAYCVDGMPMFEIVGLPDAAHHFKAVHAGHHHDCHQHVGTEVEELAQSLFTVCCGVDDEVLSFQCVLDNHGEGLFVLNQKYSYLFHNCRFCYK